MVGGESEGGGGGREGGEDGDEIFIKVLHIQPSPLWCRCHLRQCARQLNIYHSLNKQANTGLCGTSPLPRLKVHRAPYFLG